MIVVVVGCGSLTPVLAAVKKAPVKSTVKTITKAPIKKTTKKVVKKKKIVKRKEKLVLNPPLIDPNNPPGGK